MTKLDSNIIEARDAGEFMCNLPASSAQLILTDPPYNCGVARHPKSGWDGVYQEGVDTEMRFASWDKEHFDVYQFAERCQWLLKPGGYLVMFYDFWKMAQAREAFTKAGLSCFRILVWEKTNKPPGRAHGAGGYIPASKEFALFAKKKGGQRRIEFHNGIYQYPIPNRKTRRIYHHSQKPLGLFSELMERLAGKAGDVVVDPYVGSGTTAIAAEKLGVTYWVSDIDSEVVDAFSSIIKKDLRGVP